MTRRDLRTPYPFHGDTRQPKRPTKSHRIVCKPSRWQRFLAWLRQP